MNTKIIFFDIDGTILSHRTLTISDSTKQAIKQAQANGHLAFVNTGRTLGEMAKEITDIGFDGYICGCGIYISYKGTVLHEVTIPQDKTKELISDLRKYGLEAVLEGKNAIYYDNNISNVVVEKIKREHSLSFNVKNWDDPDISIDKFCVWHKSDDDYKEFCEKYEQDFDFIIRSKSFSEVIPKGYSKATGIQYILDHLNIPQENTYALGDSTNDLPMLQYVKYSIAMGNSNKDILDLVSYVTEDVDCDGVAQALSHYGII
jgi:Cof subfamily protein (haloacid dehalogenase superfamily)